MERPERAAIIAQLVTELRHAGSWAGETHIQKAMYLMQDLLEVPTGYPFILYKHGPFSFDLSYELTSLRGDGLLELEPQTPPYGPRYAVTQRGRTLCQKFSKILEEYAAAIQKTAEAIGARTVSDLEQLTTALFVTRRFETEHGGSVDARAKYLNRLKPHISLEAAREAVKEIDALIQGRILKPQVPLGLQ